jgi:hypothetical protein
MYKVVASSCNDSAKALTASLSTSRPAIWAEELLHVARNRARTRTWMGCVVLIGVGGGVERDRWAIFVVGDGCRLGAVGRDELLEYYKGEETYRYAWAWCIQRSLCV